MLINNFIMNTLLRFSGISNFKTEYTNINYWEGGNPLFIEVVCYIIGKKYKICIKGDFMIK